MTKTLTRIAATALVATLIPLPAFAQQMDHSSHANHQMHAMDASAEDQPLRDALVALQLPGREIYET